MPRWKRSRRSSRRRMTGRHFLLGRHSTRSVRIPAFLPSANHPLAALAIQHVRHLHAAAGNPLRRKSHRRAGRILFVRYRCHIHGHRVHVQAGLPVFRAQIVYDALFDRFGILNVFRAAADHQRCNRNYASQQCSHHTIIPFAPLLLFLYMISVPSRVPSDGGREFNAYLALPPPAEALVSWCFRKSSA